MHLNDGRSISAKFLATDAARPRNLVRQCVYLPQPRIRSKVDSEYKNQLFLASGSNFGERQQRFWTDQDFPDAPAVHARIEAKLKATGLDDSGLREAYESLQAGKEE